MRNYSFFELKKILEASVEKYNISVLKNPIFPTSLKDSSKNTFTFHVDKSSRARESNRITK